MGDPAPRCHRCDRGRRCVCARGDPFARESLCGRCTDRRRRNRRRGTRRAARSAGRFWQSRRHSGSIETRACCCSAVKATRIRRSIASWSDVRRRGGAGMKAEQLRIASGERLMARLDRLAEIGAHRGWRCCRLALTDADRAGPRPRRADGCASWASRCASTGSATSSACARGTEDNAPVMTGSHIDTVRTGGRYDGNLRRARWTGGGAASQRRRHHNTAAARGRACSPTRKARASRLTCWAR